MILKNIKYVNDGKNYNIILQLSNKEMALLVPVRFIKEHIYSFSVEEIYKELGVQQLNVEDVFSVYGLDNDTCMEIYVRFTNKSGFKSSFMISCILLKDIKDIPTISLGASSYKEIPHNDKSSK